jgi:hypothetical protein
MDCFIQPADYKREKEQRIEAVDYKLELHMLASELGIYRLVLEIYQGES